MKVEHKADGYSAYCWRCSDHGWIPHPQPSLAERLAALVKVREAELHDTATLTLPEPRQPNPQLWPAHVRVWLYKAGLSNDDIEGLGFYYCDRLQRVVMPVYHHGTLLYWQARGFNKDRAKYINPIVPKDTLVARFGKGDTLVLTEDILSAHKVGKVTEAWALMGTALTDGVATLIAATTKPVLIMLDPDKAGIRARGKIYKQLGALGADVRIARLDRDPKLLTKEELLQCVNLK
jgi:hypothetical protein